MSKRFGGALALDGVTLEIGAGEVHGLLGHNGSGKSTLIKILGGYHSPDGGEVLINGEQVRLPIRAREAQSLGLGFVHQDLGLEESLTVLENLRITELASHRRAFINWPQERRRALRLFADYKVRLDPDAKVESLPAWDKALLAIIRAVEAMREARDESGSLGLLILDEPTAFLPKNRKDDLYELIRSVSRTGAAVLFVSHDLEEVMEITDRVTVLRDGKVVGDVRTADITSRDLVALIVGTRHAEQPLAEVLHAGSAPSVSIEGLTGAYVEDVSFSVRNGEILGLTGLLGSGFEEIPYLVTGARRPLAGSLTIDGRSFDLPAMTTWKAKSLGIVLVPEDRLRQGGVSDLTIGENATLPVLDRFFRTGFLHKRALRKHAARLLQDFWVRPPRPDVRYQTLSGGNQQKVVLAKWMQLSPRLLLLHEPTKGVDVGARTQIFRLISRLAQDGSPILCISGDHDQLASICTRILVFGNGRVARELTGDQITKHRITEQSYVAAGVE